MLTKNAGITKGDRVAIMLPRLPEYWLMSVACLRTGIRHSGIVDMPIIAS